MSLSMDLLRIVSLWDEHCRIREGNKRFLCKLGKEDSATEETTKAITSCSKKGKTSGDINAKPSSSTSSNGFDDTKIANNRSHNEQILGCCPETTLK
eukprot:832694-Ditylum_brightwellii.AAC.1